MLSLAYTTVCFTEWIVMVDDELYDHFYCDFLTFGTNNEWLDHMQCELLFKVSLIR